MNTAQSASTDCPNFFTTGTLRAAEGSEPRAAALLVGGARAGSQSPDKKVARITNLAPVTGHEPDTNDAEKGKGNHEWITVSH